MENIGQEINFSDLFKNSLEKKFSGFDEILNAVEINSDGKIWGIGSFVYGGLVEEIYGREYKFNENVVDFDFLVERPSRELSVPCGWKPCITRYGNIYFLKSDLRIDLNYLVNFHSIVSRDLHPNIKNYLAGVPLNVQSIVYDFNEEKILGDVGIRSIENQLVKVNNLNEARFDAEIKNVSLKKMISEKADRLGFSYLL